ncbi:ABC transporter permease [Paracoccus pacificus]|uniref:ABC transporter permease n=1 Tax=Paracoccus pacificus TaxID=1463598 RepID=A0ABW4R2Z1_9RHOB
MFVSPRRPANMVEAALVTLSLIYDNTVHKLRMNDRNAIYGLFKSILQSVALVLVFYLSYSVMGIRSSPMRGDFILFIMSGIFLYMTHVSAVGAVAMAEGPTSPMMKHTPMNTAISITSAALAALYRQVIASLVIFYVYTATIAPLHMESWRGCLAMLLLAWFSGCCVGLIFRSISAWFPGPGRAITVIYQRVNMIASGKMFVANTLPGFMLAMFDWNPLFHIIDQTRGFAFINYTPHNSNWHYPLYVTIALLMIGLMLEFVTRRAQSISWHAAR